MTPALWWIVIGFVLMIAELFVPAFVMVFLGIAAVLTGFGLMLGMPGDGGVPYLVFSAIAVVTLLLFRKRLRDRLGVRGETVDAGVPDEDFLGRHGVVSSGFDATTPNRGLVQFRGTQWNAETANGPFAPEQRVVITARTGALLTVEATEN